MMVGTICVSRTPPVWVLPYPSRWFVERLRTATLKREKPTLSLTATGSTSTGAEADSARAAERRSRATFQVSASTDTTRPVVPALSAAVKVNSPTLAPMSQTVFPGLTNSVTSRRRVGSTSFSRGFR